MSPRRFLFLLSRIFFIVVTALCLLVGAVLTRLYIEPIDLTFLTPKLVRFLEADLGKSHLHLTDPHLRWRGLGHSLEISAQNLEIKTLEKTGLSLQIPTFYLTFRFRSLLLGRLLPSTLTLQAPKIIYHPQASTLSNSNDTNQISQQDSLTVLTDVFTANNYTKILKRIRIINASLSLDLGENFGVWQIPKTTFVVNRKQGFIDALWDLQLDKDQKMTVSFAYLPKEALWKFNLHLDSISLPFFAQKLSQYPTFNKPFLQEIANSHFPLTGSLKGVLSNTFDLQESSFYLTSEKGTLDLPSLLLPQRSFQDAIFEGSFDKGNWVLSQFSCVTQGADLYVSGGLKKNKAYTNAHTPDTEFSPHASPYTLSVNATLKNFFLENLDGSWPHGIASPARTWLIQHLKKGKVPKGTFSMTGQITENFENFSLQSLEGDIHLTNAALRYLDTMPEVKNLSAEAHYDASHFSIHVTQGESAGLDLNKGHVLITGLDKDFQDIDIKTTTTGPLKGALHILNSPPLSLLKETALKVEECQGNSITDLHLNFPLDDRFDNKGIQFSATTSLEKASIPRPLPFLPIDLSNADIALKVNNNQLEATGKAHLNQLPATISWKRSLDPKKISETVHIKAPMTPAFIKNLGVDIGPYLKGILPGDILYARTSPADSYLTVALDLTPALPNFWGLGENL